jgi:hypothetical protein
MTSPDRGVASYRQRVWAKQVGCGVPPRRLAARRSSWSSRVHRRARDDALSLMHMATGIKLQLGGAGNGHSSSVTRTPSTKDRAAIGLERRRLGSGDARWTTTSSPGMNGAICVDWPSAASERARGQNWCASVWMRMGRLAPLPRASFPRAKRRCRTRPQASSGLDARHFGGFDGVLRREESEHA